MSNPDLFRLLEESNLQLRKQNQIIDDLIKENSELKNQVHSLTMKLRSTVPSKPTDPTANRLAALERQIIALKDLHTKVDRSNKWLRGRIAQLFAAIISVFDEFYLVSRKPTVKGVFRCEDVKDEDNNVQIYLHAVGDTVPAGEPKVYKVDVSFIVQEWKLVAKKLDQEEQVTNLMRKQGHTSKFNFIQVRKKETDKKGKKKK